MSDELKNADEVVKAMDTLNNKPPLEESISKPKAEDVPKEVPRVEEVPEIKKEDLNTWVINNLPSKGIFYAPGTKIMGRPLNVVEVKMLASINENNVNHIINQVLTRVITGININELLVADKLYIIFWLRANTYKDDGYKVEFDCLECSQTSDYEFNLKMLNVNFVNEKIDINKEMVTPNGKIRFKARYLNVINESKVSDFLDSYRGSEEFDEDILNISNMILEINGEELTLLQKYNFFMNECSPTDYAYIESYIKHIDFGVDPIMDIKCTKCGGYSPVAISFRPDFFIPQYTFN